MKLIISTILTIFILNVGAQKSSAQFNFQNIKYFNGFYVDVKALIPLPDEGIMWIGNVSHNGPFNFNVPIGGIDYDILIMRLDKNFNVVWNKRIGGSQQDWVESAVQCKDGGFLITGGTESNDGLFTGYPLPPAPAYRNLYVLKTDSLGNLIWLNTVAGQYTQNYNSYTVIEEISGGAFIAGVTDTSGGDFDIHYGPLYSNDWFVAKFDNAGNKLWVKIKGGSNSDMQCKMVSDENGGLYFTSFTGSDDYDLANNAIPFGIGPHGYIGHWDSAGNIIWGRTCGGTGWNVLSNLYYDTEFCRIIIGGFTNSIDYDLQGHNNFTGEADYWVMLFDTLGNVKWSKAWGGEDEEKVFTISKNYSTKNYLVGGYSYSKNGDLDSLHTQMNYDADAWIIAIDTNGILKRKRQIGGNDKDAVLNLVSTQNKVYVFGGTESVDDDFITHTPQYTDGSSFIAELLDYPDGTIENDKKEDFVEVYPNPATDNLFIKSEKGFNVRLMDMNGRIVLAWAYKINESISIKELPSGMYVLSIYNDNFNTSKIILKH